MCVIRFTTWAFEHRGHNTWLQILTFLLWNPGSSWCWISCSKLKVPAHFVELTVFLKDSYDLEGQWMSQRVRLPGYLWKFHVFIKYSVATESVSKNPYPTPNFPLVQMWSCGRWSLGWLWAVQKWRYLWPAIVSSQIFYCGMFPFSPWAKTLGIFFPSAFFFVCPNALRTRPCDPSETLRNI